MTQLVHNDGSASDTVIEVNLRYPGDRDRNLVSAPRSTLAHLTHFTHHIYYFHYYFTNNSNTIVIAITLV